MKINPKKNQMVGRIVDLAVSEGGLELPNVNGKVTVFILIDTVGPDVNDCKPGEIVLVHKFNHIHLRGGQEARVILDDTDVRATIEDVPMRRFRILGSEAAA